MFLFFDKSFTVHLHVHTQYNFVHACMYYIFWCLVVKWYNLCPALYCEHVAVESMKVTENESLLDLRCDPE